jgi:alpha-methylacyl-CoA racemase
MGPLEGVKIIEIAGLGALPFGCMSLSDMGAEIIRVDRVSGGPAAPGESRNQGALDRGRRSIAIDFKRPEGVETLLRLAERVDALLESFRPGVVERLGIGPDVALARNPRLIYGRLTGWGQSGPLAHAAGHSLNYEAITGAIRTIGPRGGPPVPLLQILGDFAGGGLLLAYGVVCALLEARRSGRGQVVDAAMADGVLSLMGIFFPMTRSGMHSEQMGENLFDGGSPFYNVYETRDGKYVSVAPIEPHFYQLLLDKLGISAADLPAQYDRACWPELRERLAAVFRTRTRAEWCELLEGTDACFAPVLTPQEAVRYPHNSARECFWSFGPNAEPAVRPVPRFSRTPPEFGAPLRGPGADTDAVLADFGFSRTEVGKLRASGAVA